MNAAQAHLLLNHVPVLGVVFATALTLAGAVRRKDDLVKAGLWAFVLAGLSALPAFYTGDEAGELIEHLPGVAESLIHEHEEAAEKALAAALALGGAALWVLLYSLKTKRLSEKGVWGVLLLTIPAFGVLAWAAHLGGFIRHPEVRPNGRVVPIEGALPAKPETDEKD